jgi:hypothetical protein
MLSLFCHLSTAHPGWLEDVQHYRQPIAKPQPQADRIYMIDMMRGTSTRRQTSSCKSCQSCPANQTLRCNIKKRLPIAGQPGEWEEGGGGVYAWTVMRVTVAATINQSIYE